MKQNEGLQREEEDNFKIISDLVPHLNNIKLKRLKM